jgi:DsbC/DsbD-like thiol-disulfide interchange protein
MVWHEAKPEEASAAAPGGAEAAASPAGPLARAQRGPVIATATADKRRIRPGETVELALTLEIDPGWHIQSAKPTRSALIATSVELGVAEGLSPGEMRFPDGSLAPVGGEKLSVYQGKVMVKVAITASRDCTPGRAPVIARIRFQACDDTRCLQPERVEVEFAIEVG